MGDGDGDASDTENSAGTRGRACDAARARARRRQTPPCAERGADSSRGDASVVPAAGEASACSAASASTQVRRGEVVAPLRARSRRKRRTTPRAHAVPRARRGGDARRLFPCLVTKRGELALGRLAQGRLAPEASRSARASDSAARARTSASGAALVMTASAVFRPGKLFPVSFAEEPGPARDPRLTRAMLLSCSSRASTLASETLVPSARLASVASLARRDAGAGPPPAPAPRPQSTARNSTWCTWSRPAARARPGGREAAFPRSAVAKSRGERRRGRGERDTRAAWNGPPQQSQQVGTRFAASLRKSDAKAVAAHVADVPSSSAARRRARTPRPPSARTRTRPRTRTGGFRGA